MAIKSEQELIKDITEQYLAHNKTMRNPMDEQRLISMINNVFSTKKITSHYLDRYSMLKMNQKVCYKYFSIFNQLGFDKDDAILFPYNVNYIVPDKDKVKLNDDVKDTNFRPQLQITSVGYMKVLKETRLSICKGVKIFKTNNDNYTFFANPNNENVSYGKNMVEDLHLSLNEFQSELNMYSDSYIAKQTFHKPVDNYDNFVEDERWKKKLMKKVLRNAFKSAEKFGYSMDKPLSQEEKDGIKFLLDHDEGSLNYDVGSHTFINEYVDNVKEFSTLVNGKLDVIPLKVAIQGSVDNSSLQSFSKAKPIRRHDDFVL